MKKRTRTRTRLATSALATGILMGGGIAGALADDVAAPAATQQSNMTITQADLTEMSVLVPGGHTPSDRPGPASETTNPFRTFVTIFNDRDGVTGADLPVASSPPFTGSDGKKWIAVHVDPARNRFDKGISEDGIWFIPASAVVSSQSKAVYDAAIAAAEAAKTKADDDKYAADQKFTEAFAGEGTVKPDAGWYTTDDGTGAPVATAAFPGQKAAMSQAYKGADNQQWQKMAGKDDTGKNATFFVKASDVKDYAPTPGPTESTGVTGANMAPEVTGIAEGEVNLHPANATATQTPAAHEPNNLGIVGGIALVVVLAGGGYVWWDRKRKATAAKATAESE